MLDVCYLPRKHTCLEEGSVLAYLFHSSRCNTFITALHLLAVHHASSTLQTTTKQNDRGG